MVHEIDVIIGIIETVIEDAIIQGVLIDAIVEMSALCYEDGQESILERLRPQWMIPHGC